MPHRDKSEYIWGEADWPHDGWAGSESTPVPTCVSPGVGLGSKKGTHLGLGGATIGSGGLVRAGRDLTGGGAFGIPGYAGIGASGLGWGIQEEFDEFVDPPATMDNVRTTAFSTHPSRPFFLVGSSNTHVYLWEVFDLYRNHQHNCCSFCHHNFHYSSICYVSVWFVFLLHDINSHMKPFSW